MYEQYKAARNRAWKILIEAGIDRLPIDLKKLCKTLYATVIPYSQMGEKTLSDFAATGDGFTLALNRKQRLIVVNDAKSIPRMRFTLAHELGHIALNHTLKPVVYRNSEIDNNQKPEEIQASIFARDLLMPACVLAALHVTTVDEIMQICNVSFTSAQIRLNRLLELYKRNMFGVHPLERQVIAQFDQFIKNNK